MVGLEQEALIQSPNPAANWLEERESGESIALECLIKKRESWNAWILKHGQDQFHITWLCEFRLAGGLYLNIQRVKSLIVYTSKQAQVVISSHLILGYYDIHQVIFLLWPGTITSNGCGWYYGHD